MSDWPVPGITEVDVPEPDNEPIGFDDVEPEDDDE